MGDVKTGAMNRKKPAVLLCPVCGRRLTPNKGWAEQFYDGYCNYCNMPVEDAIGASGEEVRLDGKESV